MGHMTPTRLEPGGWGSSGVGGSRTAACSLLTRERASLKGWG